MCIHIYVGICGFKCINLCLVCFHILCFSSYYYYISCCVLLKFLGPSTPIQCNTAIHVLQLTDSYFVPVVHPVNWMPHKQMTYFYDYWSIIASETIFVIYLWAYMVKSHFNKSLNQIITVVQSWRMRYNLLMKLQVVDLNKRRLMVQVVCNVLQIT